MLRLNKNNQPHPLTRFLHLGLLASLLLSGLLPAVLQAETQSVRVILKDHKFQPSEVNVPANTGLTLVIENRDPTPEEFESEALHRAKVIAGNSSGEVRIGPLKPGYYPFRGDFHRDSAQGAVVAR